jgi:hypothetical protein
VAGTLGYGVIEWAAAGGAIHLLQAGAAPPPPPADAGADPVAAAGRRVRGTVSVPGDAVGRLRFVRPHEGVPAGGPYLLDCRRPVPALAPLLFGASGLVSLAGPADCHLTEVARALGVPCLVNTPVDRVTGSPDQINAGDWLAAIDGSRHELVVLPAGAGDLPELTSAVRTITSSLAPGRPAGSGEQKIRRN